MIGPLKWRNRLLRQCLDSGGVGVLIWYLPVMEGGAFYYTSEAAAVLARYEPRFREGRRCDEQIKVDGLPDGNWFAYQRGRDRLLLLLNTTDEPLSAMVALPAGWTGAVACDPVTGKPLPGAPKGTIMIPANGCRVVTAKG